MTDGFSSARLSALLEAGGSVAGVEMLREVGLLDADVAERLMVWREVHEPHEGAYYAEDEPLYQRILKKNVSANLVRAVREGNDSVLQFARGVESEDRDGFGGDFISLRKIESWLDEEGQLIVWGGRMGRGKSNAMLRCLEWWTAKYPNGVIIHNLKSLRADCRDVYVGGIDELEEAIEEYGESGEGVPVAVGLDEMSSHATGYAKDSSVVVEQLAGLVRLMRHEGVRLMQLVGHRVEADIHPSLRELADIALKPALKEVEVYDAIGDAGSSDPVMAFDVDAVSWRYDDKEDTVWEWRESDDDGMDWEVERRRLMAMVYTEFDIGYREVARLFESDGLPSSASTVRRAVEEFGAEW